MLRRNLGIMAIALCVGLIVFLASGCAKKTLKQSPSMKSAEELAAEQERARLEAERLAKEKELARLKDEEARRREEEARKREEEARKREQDQKEFEKTLLAKRTPGIEGEVYESKLLRRVHFDFDRYTIRPEDTEILKEDASVLKKFPSVKIQIEGHCDERGTNEYNLALGERRASSTKQYLISLGVQPARISVISYGEERPLDSDHNEEAWAKNRRADFVILSK
jgi:peptidoglycan-associated lipoprotein